LSRKQELLLFVSGMSFRSVTAIENIHLLIEKFHPENFSLRIIDINIEKEEAVKYQIVAIPTLIRLMPEPKQIIIGDLSDTKKVVERLDLDGIA